jgi:hypothetical protein
MYKANESLPFYFGAFQMGPPSGERFCHGERQNYANDFFGGCLLFVFLQKNIGLNMSKIRKKAII